MRYALPLPGWEQASTWGYDEQQGSLFAQLYRNGDDGGAEPRVWITPGARWPIITSGEVLASAIAVSTGSSMRDVLLALADQAPAPLCEHFRELATA